MENVLGSARTELIFTRSQEGTQVGRLTQTVQTKQGVWYHVLSCWVPVGEDHSIIGWKRLIRSSNPSTES